MRAKLMKRNKSWYYIRTKRGPIGLRRLGSDKRYLPVTRRVALACLALVRRDGGRAALPCFADWSDWNE